MPNEEDLVALRSKSLSFKVHLGHERARSVDGLEVAFFRLNVHRRSDPVRRKNDGRAFGHFVKFLDENRAALFESLHDVPVVNDLLSYVDGSAIQL
jgi:hypothetical protein